MNLTNSLSDDCISRRAAIDVVIKYFEHVLNLNPDICADGIRSLPSVMSQGSKWISVIEEYPPVNTPVLVTDWRGSMCVYKLKSDSEDVAFYWEDDAGYFVDFDNVIAWMLLPASYKETKE